MYLRVKERFEKIMLAKTVIDTEQPLEDCVRVAQAALAQDRSSTILGK